MQSSNGSSAKGANITNLRLRKSFAQISEPVEVPNLVAIQRASYERFLQLEVEPSKRQDVGLHRVLKGVFPIKDYNSNYTLEYVSYTLGEPKYQVDECRERGMTWAAPLRVTIHLVTWETDEETGVRSPVNVKEDVVYFGELPLMTDKGTFMINGTERVIVSQLHRSPGVFFGHDDGKSHVSGKLLYSARVIPYRGSWLDLEFDIKDVLHARIDRRRKLHVSILLRALGLSEDEILDEYYKKDYLTVKNDGTVVKRVALDQLEGQKAFREIKVDGKIIVKAGGKFNRAVLRRLKEAAISEIEVDPEVLFSSVSAITVLEAQNEVVDPNTGEVIAEQGDVLVGWSQIKERLKGVLSLSEEDARTALTQFVPLIRAGEELRADKVTAKGDVVELGNVSNLKRVGINEVPVLYLDDNHIGESLLKTLLSDKMSGDGFDLYGLLMGTPGEESILEIYRRLRPGEPPRAETAKATFHNIFFNPDRYDLSDIGRYKINHKLYISQGREAPSIEERVLVKSDIVESIRYILELKNGGGDNDSHTVDDIDHLGNRRVRSVGELVENQFRVGLVRLERAVKEKMGSLAGSSLVPQDLINYKPVGAVVKEFFGSSQLSQFMDQTNPLSEITHKRRLSALGPGGLTRDRAGSDVRDVNPTHYGRICPIETPEGPNIGLIASLAVYSRVNDFGFLETPYRLVDNEVVSGQVVYMSALEEAGDTIAAASSKIDESGRFIDGLVNARRNGEYISAAPCDVTKVDVSPRQIVSVAASLIPFLENDDANRALMGSNMQRQAVPCIKPQAPVVGTGMEVKVAKDSGATILAKRAGKVVSVDSRRIVIRSSEKLEAKSDTGVDIYPLAKYRRSNQNTCLSQRALVREGEFVEKSQVIGDGASTDSAELGLGQNVVVAFMPWCGYNFEDSILINQRLIQQDYFTSIHIEEFECVARDTKLGAEEITRDIPNLGEDFLKDLDEHGTIRIGAEVAPGSILVGKVTPKSESQLSPEEKLLRAIFGEKAGEVRDTSVRLPPGVEGVVINVQTFTRKGAEKDEKILIAERGEIERLQEEQKEDAKIILDNCFVEICELLISKVTTCDLLGDKREVLLSKGSKLTEEILSQLPFEFLRDLSVGDEEVEEQVNEVMVRAGQHINIKRANLAEKIARLQEGDELAPGVIKLVKVFVAIKRKLQVGDKLAGRHGNKGVLSRIVAEEDMPFLADGTSVDVVLNPLGVPSRMNIGQILETHLGLVSWELSRMITRKLESIIDMQSYLRLPFVSEARYKDTLLEIKKIIDRVFGKQADEVLVDVNGKLCEVALLRLSCELTRGVHFATPVFDGAKEAEIKDLLEFCGLERDGKVQLYDGRTGEAFSQRATVGIMHFLKLDHLVDDKIHARSIGPYSLVTQQPLGGKAQFGGQRLGEMEVWALEAYGAAYTLRELLTTKSDDVSGRVEAYQNVVKGWQIGEPGLPESFNVMMKELQSLALDVQLCES